jgi:hypothetical protein
MTLTRSTRKKLTKQDPIVKKVLHQYLTSHDFNGLPARDLLSGSTSKKLAAKVGGLATQGLLTIEFGDRHPNPHIKCFQEEPVEVAVEKLGRLGLQDACLYPSRTVLANAVDQSKYSGRPYDLALALGEGQLALRFFDLVVLEKYRNDPRFHYDCNDVGGRFSAKWEATESGVLPPKDQTFIQEFGFAYNKDLDRCVAGFVRDLARLNPTHQQIWRAHELDPAEWSPHPGWWASMMGNWPDRVPLFEAFIAELRVANEMCRAAGWPALYREDFTERPRPSEFAFLLRPTLAAFNRFVHLLDKVMSENLSQDFFKHHRVAPANERVDSNGKVIIEKKGTIQLLDEWLKARFRPADPAPLADAIQTFKDVRKLRQKPAHALDEDAFDPGYYRQQRELVHRSYGAVRLIRLVLANHPAARRVEVPDWLYKGAIWPF